MIRVDGRRLDQLRPVRITPGAQEFAEGSVAIETGRTRVLCAVSVEDRVPPFLKGAGQGWITAEYGMLPRSTVARTPRRTRARGRTHEIQRMIGRSLRVLQADGGTRTAWITGGRGSVSGALDGRETK